MHPLPSNLEEKNIVYLILAIFNFRLKKTLERLHPFCRIRDTDFGTKGTTPSIHNMESKNETTCARRNRPRSTPLIPQISAKPKQPPLATAVLVCDPINRAGTSHLLHAHLAPSCRKSEGARTSLFAPDSRPPCPSLSAIPQSAVSTDSQMLALSSKWLVPNFLALQSLPLPQKLLEALLHDQHTSVSLDTTLGLSVSKRGLSKRAIGASLLTTQFSLSRA